MQYDFSKLNLNELIIFQKITSLEEQLPYIQKAMPDDVEIDLLSEAGRAAISWKEWKSLIREFNKQLDETFR